MGVKFGHALGAHVVVFTTSPGKKEDALRLGADEVVVSRNADEMKKHAGSFDFIRDAVSAEHDISAYIQLLRRDGNITLVGAPEKPLSVPASALSWAGAAFRVRRSAVSPRPRRCSTFAVHIKSPPTSKSSRSREGQRGLREIAQVRCEIPLLDRYGFSQS